MFWYLTDLVSVCIIVWFAYPVLRFAETRDPAFLAMLVGMIFAEAGTKIVKIATATSKDAWLKRPDGARGCDALCAKGDVSGAPGFPSGHVTSTAFFFTYLAAINGSPQLLVAGGIGVTLAVAASRVIKKCHTPFQVAVGAAWGSVAAVITYCAISGPRYAPL
jgi:membrane-associated phospholipid phosphatase